MNYEAALQLLNDRNRLKEMNIERKVVKRTIKEYDAKMMQEKLKKEMMLNKRMMK